MSGPPSELRARLIQAAYEAAVAQGRYEAPLTRRAPSRARVYRDGRLTLLAPHFDYAFYAFENPDFADTGLDELEHFNFFGWPKLRNPTAWFDVGYYLSHNPDVFAAGDNPFWHYIFKGRAEGRAPRRPRGSERAMLDAAPLSQAPAPMLPRLSAPDLAARLASACAGAESLTYAFGGTRDEGVTLQAAPLRGGGPIRSLPAPWSETRLAVEGETLGFASDADIAKALGLLGANLPARRVFAVHSLAGASVEGLLAVESALAPTLRRFHLDDWSSLCAQADLLRNDVAACAAPPLASTACTLCRHGEMRAAQLAGVERLFAQLNFAVVSPSAFALDFWRHATALAHEAAEVVPPLRWVPGGEGPAPETGVLGAEGRPVRVAFLGAPTLAAGWLTYERLLEACGGLVAYAFHHFADGADLRPNRNLFNVEASPGALRDLLIARRIDLVVAAAETPVPFSPSALAALAAGCDLVALGHSGHAAELVETERRGRLFEDGEAALDFFTDGRAVAYARERDRFARLLGDLVGVPA